MTIPLDFPEWLKTHPAPDMQELVALRGGYSNISPQDWIDWDAACAAWESARRDRLLGSHTWAVAEIKRRKRKSTGKN
jgi:hypothetical protein